MAEPVLAYPCGTQVTVSLGGFRGMITCVSNRFDNITYEITYFLGGEQRIVWLNQFEFKPMGDLQMVEVTGFKQS